MKVSPEEKLFNIIQQGKQPSGGALNLKAPGIKLSLHNAAISLSGLFRGRLPFSFKSCDLDLAAINKILAGILIAAALITGYCAFYGPRQLRRALKPQRPIAAAGLKSNNIIPLGPLASFSDTVLNRDIFKPGNTQPASARTGPWRLQELAKDLKLVGIYQGHTPEVMIEDTTLKKTYFLKEGEEVKGVFIKSITKDKVVLSSGSEEMEMH